MGNSTPIFDGKNSSTNSVYAAWHAHSGPALSATPRRRGSDRNRRQISLRLCV